MSHYYEELEDALDMSRKLAVYLEAATERAMEVTMALHMDLDYPAGDIQKKDKVRTLKMRVNLQKILAGNQKQTVDKLVEEALIRLETGQSLGDQVVAAHDALDAFNIILKQFDKELWTADDYLRAELRRQKYGPAN